MAAQFPPFFERPPWLTGDLQTLRNIIRRPFHDLSSWPERRIDLPLSGGDRLVALIHHPVGRPKAMAILIHGLGGSADSVYVRSTARHLLSSGFGVIRLNLRGAGLSASLCRSQYHAGRSEDIRAAIAALTLQSPVAAIGYSLGGNVLLKYLGEEGRDTPLAAAIAISTPLDLAAASQRLLARRNRFYQDYLVARMKVDALAAPSALTSQELRTVQEARTVFELDDRFIAPRHGFADAADYYARCSASRYLDCVRIPTLVIHGLNDPWIPADAYHAVPWDRLPSLTPLLTRGGGHVGFHGIDSRVPWHDRCLALFLDRLVNQ